MHGLAGLQATVLAFGLLAGCGHDSPGPPPPVGGGGDTSPQTQFSELRRHYLPETASSGTSVAVGDVDADGDLDLVFGGWYEPNRLFLNDGGGQFTDATATHMPKDWDFTYAVALGDIDGDRDLDLIVGNGLDVGVLNRVYLNNGRGQFTDASASRLPADKGDTRAVVLGDVDGDRDLDLVTAGASGWKSRLYLNDGSGRFTDATSNLSSSITYTESFAVELGDVDGDGDPDLVFGNRGQNQLFRNDGNGRFVDVSTHQLPQRFDLTGSVALADVDGDGDRDLVLGNGLDPWGDQNSLYLNDGKGKFTDATAASMPIDTDISDAVVLGDVDADGDLDLVFGNGENQQNKLYLNDGNGKFSDATASNLPKDRDAALDLAIGDVDGDGDPDLVLANYSWAGRPNRLYLNDGRAMFADANAPPLQDVSAYTVAVVAGDIDGDGGNDLVFVNGGDQNRIYRNDRFGRFSDVTASSLPELLDPSEDAVLGDVDGDGDRDLVFANSSGRNELYFNDGAGKFSSRWGYGAGRGGRCVALGDVDSDGDPDLVFGVLGQNELYLNNGKGWFTYSTTGRLPKGDDESISVVLGDVDGDGDLDLVFGNGDGQDQLYLNDGTGRFSDVTASRMPYRYSTTYATVMGDVDGDRDPDLVFANGDGPIRLYINDGKGKFTDASAWLPQAKITTLSVALGDVDGDGDPDLVFGSIEHTLLYLNDGRGRFSDASASRLPYLPYSPVAVPLVDLDGDGDLDLVLGIYAGQNRLVFNTHRQIHAPLLAILGRRYRLELFATPGYGTAVQSALPLLSLSPATPSIPVPPFGSLELGPVGLVALPPVPIPATTGKATIEWTNPPSPSLLGQTLYVQALTTHRVVPPESHFTNAIGDRFVR